MGQIKEFRADAGVAFATRPIPFARGGQVSSRFDTLGGLHVRRFVRATADLLFPPSCAFCEVDLALPHSAGPPLLLCNSCRQQLSASPGPTCRRCGLRVPAVGETEPECAQCRGVRFHFDGVASLGLYQGALREAVLRTKHAAEFPLMVALSRLLWESRGEILRAFDVELVCWVPMHWRRQLERGSNAVELLAEEVSRSLGLGRAWRALRRCRHTPPQTSLTLGKRLQNVRGAFAVRRGYNLKGARVLLLDDVVTTGATSSEAARALRSAGAEFVAVAAIARAEGPR